MEMLYEFDLEYEEESPFGKDPQKDFKHLENEILKNDKNIDFKTIEKAYWYMVNAHNEVYRKSGMPYYSHPFKVTLILLNEFSIFDTDSLAGCLLHDTIEDVEGIKKHKIEEEFNGEIAEIVDGVTKIAGRSHYDDSYSAKKIDKTETYRKLFLALVKDIRVILIKLADRLHNMRTLHYLKPHKQKDIALETLNFYVPFAHRLGLTKVKMELENRSFYYSDRSAYEAIREALNEKRRDFIDYIRMFTDLIQNSLNEQNFDYTISIVHKHEYEIYRMIQDGKTISDIDNFYSMVVILNTGDVHECYRAHGVLANAFNTVSFVDYIANPKLDWYKSLNTVLFGPDGKRVEILIRTEEMEKIAEEGFAAKFSLKSGRTRALEFSDKEIQEWGEWMKDIIKENKENASQIIWDSIKVNLFDSELSVFTKEGSQYKLPGGSSILDFAFAVSEEAGLHCVTGKVNGLIRDLSYKLNSGDQIEIITSPNVKPKPEWETYVVSHKAVVTLHRYFNYHEESNHKEENLKDHEIRLKIHGEDREGMLMDITDAIGRSYIKRINLDTSGSMFEGALTLKVMSKQELKGIFSKLLGIKGVKGVEKLEKNDE